jgi:flagellar basal-body rod protein FlgB
MDLIDSQTTKVVAKALDGVSKRHTAIASNIANSETPGYKSIQVEFEGNLKQAIEIENNGGKTSKFLPEGSLKETNSKHFNPNPVATSTASSQAHVERSKFLYRYDKNGVDIEKSMAELAKNSGRYSALARLEGKMFNSLRSVIRGGGG